VWQTERRQPAATAGAGRWRGRATVATAAGCGAVEWHRQIEQAARAVQPHLHVVALPGLGDRSALPTGQVEAIKLRCFVAAAAAFVDDVGAGDGLVGGLAHRIGEGGQQLGFGARRSEPEDLRRIGAARARGDQHLGAQRMPVDEGLAAELRIPRDLRHDAGRDRRDAFDVQVGVGRDDGVGRAWCRRCNVGRRPGRQRVRRRRRQARAGGQQYDDDRPADRPRQPCRQAR
jgi:hypothetical protein